MITKREYEEAIRCATAYRVQSVIANEHLSADELREMRELAFLSRREASELSGVGQRAIEVLEYNKTAPRTFDKRMQLKDAYRERFSSNLDRIRFIDLDDEANTLFGLRQVAAVSPETAMIATGIRANRIYEYEKGTPVACDIYMRLVAYYLDRIAANLDRAADLFGLDRREMFCRFKKAKEAVVTMPSGTVVPTHLIDKTGETDEICAAKTAAALRNERLAMSGARHA